MKILFIQQSSKPVDLRDDTGMVGLLSIGTYIKQFGSFENIRILDTCFDNPIKEIRKFKPDIVGISSMTITMNKSINLANQIKQNFDIPIILGGVHVSTLPNSLPKEFDVGVVGEGEQTALELFSLFEKKGELKSKKINGLVYYRNNRITLTKPRKLIEPIDNIPIPDRSLLTRNYYRPTPDWSGKKYIKAGVITARGCPYRCRFCSTSAFWEKVRFHTAEHVVDELEILNRKYKVQMVNILDDFFSLHKNRLREIARLMGERDLTEKLKFTIQARTNTINEEMCKILKKIGVVSLNFGFESGNERMLKWLKRESVSVKDNKKAVKISTKYGFSVIGSLIFGSPGETIGEMRDTLKFIEWMYKNHVESVWFFVATPYPKTEFWEIAKKRGLVFDNMNWGKLSLINFKNPILLDENIDKKEFNKIIEKATDMKTKFFDVNNKTWMTRSPIMNLKALLSQTETSVSKPKLLLEIGKKALNSKLRVKKKS